MSYKDGVGIERCETCQSALRAKDGEPLRYVPAWLLEQIQAFIQHHGCFGSDIGDAWTDYIVAELAHVTGRTVQIQADADEVAPGIWVARRS